MDNETQLSDTAKG